MPATITEDATLKDLKTINHGKASAKWIMQMAKVLEMYPDDKDGDEKLRIDWDYKDRRTAKDSKRKMLLLAAAIEASETGAPAEGDPDSIDAAVAETYRIFPSNVYSTPLLRHLAATRDERKEARQGSSASGQKSSNASKVVPKRKAADPRTGETSLDRIPKRSKLVAAPLQPGAAAAVSSSAAADFSALMQLPAAAPSSSSPDDTGGVGKQQGDAAGASTSSMGSGVTRLKRVTGRADKKQVQAPSAQPLYAPRGLFAGDRKERAAIVALERIRISLIDPDKSASLTSGAILFATFDTSLDKFEGLGEDATSAAAFHDFCHTTGIFRKHSGKAVDDFVTWVIEKFMDGPQDRGTFLNGLVADLKNMRQLTEDRAAQTKALKEQYERDSWELLDDDARVTMEDTHPLRQV